MARQPKGEPFLPYARHQVDDADVAAVVQVLRSDWLTTGPVVTQFEETLAKRVGARHAVSCSSGTAALHLACAALGLGPGDAAVVPSVTFLATANAVRMTGAEVVFADVDPDNGLMTGATLEAALGRARAANLTVRAVLPVHLAGQCADLAAIAPPSWALGAAVIEDACHALGTYQANPDGSAAPVGACKLSDMAVFSFHPAKTVAAGEGGAITTNDAALARRLERLRCHGMVREAADFEIEDQAFDRQGTVNPWYYEMPAIGWNYRLSDIHAALGLSQLRRLDALVAERRALVLRYDDLLLTLGRGVVPIKRSRGCLPAWHLYPVLIDFAGLGITRAQLMNRLKDLRIGTQVHYIPVHRQPYYATRYPDTVLPGADEYYRRTLSLPLFAGLTPADVKRVVGALDATLPRQPARVALLAAVEQMTRLG